VISWLAALLVGFRESVVGLAHARQTRKISGPFGHQEPLVVQTIDTNILEVAVRAAPRKTATLRGLGPSNTRLSAMFPCAARGGDFDTSLSVDWFSARSSRRRWAPRRAHRNNSGDHMSKLTGLVLGVWLRAW
jgi:hypothetical protein